MKVKITVRWRESAHLIFLQVVANCICALNEMLRSEGGMAINKQIVHHVLNRMKDFNEWSQCIVLELIARYTPEDETEVSHRFPLCLMSA